MSKKIYMYFFIVLFPVMIFSQVDYEVTVIDSFTCYQGGQHGAAGIRSVEYDGNIHLSYVMQDTSGTINLMYAVKNDGGITFEIVGELSNDVLIGSVETSLQFDQNGSPNIYLGRIINSSIPNQRAIFWYRQEGSNWIGSLVSNTGYWPYLASVPDGSDELGLVFWSPSDNFFSGHITYAYYDDTNWNFKTLSTNGNAPRTRPSIVNNNSKIYITYGEGLALDTLVTRVHVKENNSWSVGYEDINITPYAGGGITGLYARLGETNSEISLLTSLHSEDGHPLHLRNDGQGWEQQKVSFDASLTAPSWRAPNLMYDSKNTVFWINQSAGSHNLSWITENGEGGIYEIPYFFSGKNLYDFFIKEDVAYIYYYEGSAGWPYGTPVTFNELKIDLNQLITNIEEINIDNHLGAKLMQNYPNPCNQNTTIQYSIDKSGFVNLSVYNFMGQKVTTLVNENKLLGDHTTTLNVSNLSSGNYSYVLKLNEGIIVRKMTIIK